MVGNQHPRSLQRDFARGRGTIWQDSSFELSSHWGQVTVRYYPKIAAWYERKKRRRNVPVAMKALACKLAKAAWHVMRGKEFDEAMLFG